MYRLYDVCIHIPCDCSIASDANMKDIRKNNVPNYFDGQ